MEITKNTHAVVIVSSEWRQFPQVKRLIGPPDNPDAVGEGSSTLEGQILDSVDQNGLWVELNSGHKKWLDRPVQKVLVPWKFVLAIVLQPDLEPPAKKVGYETSEPIPQ